MPFRFGAAAPLTDERMVVPTAEGIQRRLFGPYDPATGGQAPWLKLPPLVGLYPLGDLRPGATVLCEIDMGGGAKGQPVVAYQRYGRGVSLVCGISGTWPWRFQTSSDNTCYQAFWKEMALILIEHSRTRLRVAPVQPETSVGGSVTLEGAAFDEAFKTDPSVKVELEVVAPSGKSQKLQAQSVAEAEVTFRQAVEVSEPGAWHVTARGQAAADGKEMAAETYFFARGDSPEHRKIDLNEPLLREIASVSGGQYLHLSEYDKLADAVKPRPGTRHQVREQAAWDKPELLAALLALLLAEWLARRLGRMA